jgi:hypothetical protein
MVSRPTKDLIEIFGYAPDDLSKECRTLWTINACPFINARCSKSNHDGSVVYGTCSVSTPYGDCVICPNRLYENKYAVLRRVARECFGDSIPFLTFGEFIPERQRTQGCIVALGQNSGREVKIGTRLSMDWVLAKLVNQKLVEYVGVEVQSIDITGNYRDAWYAYKNFNSSTRVVPASEHGLNWANVHKRLIPQIIRKGNIYAKSKLVKHGLHFIVPEVVYKKFEEIIGSDIPLVDISERTSKILTIHTYALSNPVSHGKQRTLRESRTLHISLEEFSARFISGVNLPSGDDLDNAVKNVLGCN